MLLRQMKYFAAVVECGSFTEAAEQCYISQSAISQQIRTLEKELGVELLHRRNRKFTVTTAGEYFYSQCGCYAEISRSNPLSGKESVRLEELKRLPCILISSREQQGAEQKYYQNTLGFGGNYLFADSLEKGRLLVVSGRGFLPIESVGTLPPAGDFICRLPIYQGDRQIMRNYCAFWRKEQANYYIEEFADTLKKLLEKRKNE